MERSEGGHRCGSGGLPRFHKPARLPGLWKGLRKGEVFTRLVHSNEGSRVWTTLVISPSGTFALHPVWLSIHGTETDGARGEDAPGHDNKPISMCGLTHALNGAGQIQHSCE